MTKVNWESFHKDHQKRKQKLLSKKKNKGGGDSAFQPAPWAERMKYFKPTETPTRVRIILNKDGSQYYTYYSRWVKSGGGSRNVISNSWNGDPERNIPCALYYYALEEEKPELLASPNYSMTILVLEEFYKIPKTSKSGNTYFIYERSLGEDLHGRSLDPPECKDYEKIFGRKLHWSMWGTQKKQFDESLGELTEKCGHCKEGSLMVFAYTCPKCDHEIANHKVSPIEGEEEDILRNTDIVCPKCDEGIRAESQFECIKQEGYGRRAKWVPGCDNPVAVEPCTIDLTIKCTEVGKNRLIEILEFDNQEEIDLPGYMFEPFDFDRFFGQMSLEEQARCMNRENPFDDNAQSVVDKFFMTDPDKEDEHSSPREIPF